MSGSREGTNSPGTQTAPSGDCPARKAVHSELVLSPILLGLKDKAFVSFLFAFEIGFGFCGFVLCHFVAQGFIKLKRLVSNQ